LTKHDLLDFDIDEFREGVKKIVYEARDVGRAAGYGQWSSFFDDVYDQMPKHIAAQKESLRTHLEANKDSYDDQLKKFDF
jgi:TPP-dependent pyruvate/acetoin dehydrogenase alpha subunit